MSDDESDRFTLLDWGTSAPVAPAPEAPVAPPVAEPVAPVASLGAAQLAADRQAARDASVRDAATRAAMAATVVAAQEAARVAPAVAAVVAATAATATTARTVADERIGEAELISGVGDGVLIGWDGQGEISHGDLAAVLADAGISASLLPKAREPERILGAILGRLATKDRKIAKSPRGRGLGDGHWTIATADPEAAVGESFGRVSVTVTLCDGEVTTIGETALGSEIGTEYRRCRDAEIYPAGEVTAWLQTLIRDAWGGIRITGQGWYLRPRYRAVAARLHAVISRRWGQWPHRLMPAGTTEELRENLAGGLIAEIQAVLSSIQAARAQATEAGRESIGARRAATLLADLRVVAERARLLGSILDAAGLAAIRGEALAVAATLATEADDQSLRSALIWDEVINGT